MKKNTIFLPHAIKRYRGRGIKDEHLELTLNDPTWIIPTQPDGRKIHMRKFFDERLEKEVLLRVVFDEIIEERQVVSMYYTSKLAKYIPKENDDENER